MQLLLLLSKAITPRPENLGYRPGHVIFHQLVRFKADYLINRQAPLLANTSVNSLGFNLAILVPGRNFYRVSLDTGKFSGKPKIHRLLLAYPSL